MKWLLMILALVVVTKVFAEEPALSAATPVAPTILASPQETEIPVTLEPVKKAGGTENSVFKMILTLSLIGVMGCGGYFLFRKYGKPANKIDQATQIKILTQHYLGPKKSLAIIRVAGESILIGITDQNINLIKSLALLDEDVPEEVPKSFNQVFAGASANGNTGESSEDEFSITGIKDFVSSKLKNMRTFQ